MPSLVVKAFPSQIFTRLQVYVAEQWQIVVADACLHAFGFIRESRKADGNENSFYPFVEALVCLSCLSCRTVPVY